MRHSWTLKSTGKESNQEYLPSLPLELCSLATEGTQEGEGQGWGLYLHLQLEQH